MLLISSYILVRTLAFTGFSVVGKFKAIFLAAICAILNTGVAIPQGFSNPALFILWMLICSILDNLYTGQMTSYVIAPPRGKPIATIMELEENNYRLLPYKHQRRMY